MHWIRGALFLILLGLSPSRVALADEATAAQIALARDAFAAGERAFIEGNYPVALERFRAAFDAAPRNAVRFNVGVCLERLERLGEARAEYEFVATSSDVAADKRAEARVNADRLAERTAELLILGSDRDVGPIAVDGTTRCQSPCRVFLDPGTRRVVVRDTTHDVVAEPRGVVRIDPSPKVVPPTASASSTRPLQPEKLEGLAGWLTVTGAVVGAVGTAGIVGFGLRTADLHEQHLATPSFDLQEEGQLMKGLTNASIGVAALGAALVVLDLVVVRSGEHSVISSTPDGVALRFP